ncbi:MAG: polyhydroxyalkanoic acid system family protein [Planctomycetota bacterium]
MKSIEVRVPHTLERDEVRRRLDNALVRARDQYSATVGEIDATWDGDDRLRVLLTVSGMKFDGTVDILVEELVVGLQVPGMAALFAGRIREGIEERLGGLIGSQQV